jgi:hypothetical protein
MRKRPLYVRPRDLADAFYYWPCDEAGRPLWAAVADVHEEPSPGGAWPPTACLDWSVATPITAEQAAAARRLLQPDFPGGLAFRSRLGKPEAFTAWSRFVRRNRQHQEAYERYERGAA